MCKEKITVYCGEGKGKTAAALGYAMQFAAQGNSAIIIQFLKGKKEEELELLHRLEPEIKFFSFARFEKDLRGGRGGQRGGTELRVCVEGGGVWGGDGWEGVGAA